MTPNLILKKNTRESRHTGDLHQLLQDQFTLGR